MIRSRNVRSAAALAIGLLFVEAMAGGSASAQGIDIQIPRGPHYVDQPIELRVVARDFEEDPHPELDAAVSGDAELQRISVSPNVSRSIQIVNGRMTTRKEVTHIFRLRLVAHAPGRIEIGPFVVSQGADERRAPAATLNVQPLPTTDELAVALELPKGPVYVGQELPIELRFRMTRELQKSIEGYTLRVPLFERNDGVRFADAVDPRDADDDAVRVSVDTARGKLEFPAEVADERLAGRRGVEFRVARTLVPTEIGTLEIEPSLLVVERATGWQRDMFGRRYASSVSRFHARDRVRTLEVRDVPSEGRPAYFAGAVGQGFSLEVAADRTVVQVGEPIGLELVLRGGGALESASLPPLDAPGLLPEGAFRVQDGELAGSVEDGAKRFRTTVRVLDERVNEIPALRYAWFDPGSGRFETAESRPIALSVRPGRRVGAADVVSRTPAEAPADSTPGESRTAPPNAPIPPASGSLARSASLGLPSGADLSIVRDPARLLLSPSAGAPGGSLRIGAVYALGLGLAALGALVQRRRSIDPGAAARAREAAALGERVERAASLAPREAGAELADALRRLRAQAPEAGNDEFARELDRVLSECDALAFAPEGAAASVDDELIERAKACARTLAGATR